MFNTIDTKIEQLKNGFTRSGTGPKTVLIIGSCRGLPYLNFFADVNVNNALSVYFIDPFYWNYDSRDARVDLHESISRLETHSGIRALINRTEWFIHEHYENYFMFNTDRKCKQTIYDYGMAAPVDYCIPNFNNLFVLFQDIINFHHEIRPIARKELIIDKKLSTGLQKTIADIGRVDIEKFLAICKLSSFPEFGKLFQENWTKTRFFWTCNHVTSHFTTNIFEIIAGRLMLPMTPKLKDKWHKEDPYSTPFTSPTQYDVDNYGLSWPEPLSKIVAPSA